MKRLKHNFKKGMAFVLSLAMVAGLVPVMSGGANKVQAASGSGTEPSVSAYATKTQLMDNTFAPNADGTAVNYGMIVFGKKSDGTTAQEWYILGEDEGVSGDNTIIFATSPIATGQKFNSSYDNKSFASSFGVYASNPSEVYANHYGASDLRVALQGMATDPKYFTTAEQGLMNATTVKTEDTKNSNVTYTTTDKLYALQGKNYDNKLRAGTSDSTVLAMDSYWGSYSSSGDSWFWLRSPYADDVSLAMLVITGAIVNNRYVDKDYAVQPASNLNLSSVLFASAATAASSDQAKLGTIALGKAMTLRLDGTGKNIGTVTYSATTGDIKVVRGDTSQPVSLVVQGNDGTDDWYYSKQIAGPETVNASDIKSALSLTSDIDLSACKIWLETTDSTENLIYAVGATKILSITSVAITGIDTPIANATLDTSAACATTGVSSITPQITWTPSDTTAGYNTSYTASITLTADAGYEFIDSTTATINGNTATSVNKNTDGTLTVTYAFPATADKLISITAPQAITVASGTAYSAMNLPDQVNIVTEGNTKSSAQVTWNTTTPASGSYDPAVLTQQTVTLNGMVACPDSIDANGVSLTTTITITISAAGIVGAPTANPTAGTYSENQSVALTSSTVGATIYYTTDGSEPTITGGTTKQYTAPILVTGVEGQSITTTIKAIAVKNGMWDSSVETFTYTICEAIHVTGYTITATAGANGSISPSGAVGVAAGGSQTFTISPSSGYVIDTLKVDGLEVTATTSYTFSDVNSNHTIEVNFKQESQTPGVPDAGGSGNPDTPNNTYQIIDGANSSWTHDSDGNITIRGNGDFSKFTGVKLDGNLIDKSNYTAKEGSTIITLKASYLNTLSAGNHTVEILWTDGSASTTFTTKANISDNSNNNQNDNNNSNSSDDKPSSGTDKKDDVPKTGDNTPIVWLFILSILSGTGLIITVKKRRENLNS